MNYKYLDLLLFIIILYLVLYLHILLPTITTVHPSAPSTPQLLTASSLKHPLTAHQLLVLKWQNAQLHYTNMPDQHILYSNELIFDVPILFLAIYHFTTTKTILGKFFFSYDDNCAPWVWPLQLYCAVNMLIETINMHFIDRVNITWI